MSTIKHYIDFLDGLGFVEVTPPLEWKSLRFECIFDSGETRVSVNTLTWVDTPAIRMNQYIENGINGTGPGIFEALPYQITLECEGTVYNMPLLGIDLSAKETEFTCDIVKAPIRETGKIDFLTARADSFSFATLARLATGLPGKISTSDYIDIWYMVGKYPQGVEIFSAALAAFLIVKEIFESVKRFADIVAAIAGGLTGFLESLLMAIAFAIYMSFLITALSTLIVRLIDLLFPFVFVHKGMYARTLFQKGAEYLGLGFSSSIFAPGSDYYNQYILPPKNNIKGTIVGTPSAQTGYYEGTFGQFIRNMIEQYNGEVKIIGNTLHFEVEGSFASTSTYKIPEVKTLVAKGTTAKECSSNYVIEYINDKIDLNNYDQSEGRIIQVECIPAIVNDKKNITIEGLNSRLIPFTLTNVKVTTSQLESVMTDIFNNASSLLGVVASIITGSGLGGSPTIPPGGNVNILQLDTHFISEHKTGIYGLNGKTFPTSNITLGAAQLLKKFHYPKIAKGIYSGIGNQWWTYEGDIPMCCEDFLAILDNNYGTFKSSPAKILSMQWCPYDDVAKISFKNNKLFTNNLQAKIIEPGKPTIIL